MKAYTPHGVAFLPREWLTAVEAPSHVGQGDILLTAASKADAERLLFTRNISSYHAESIVRETRMVPKRGWPTSWQQLAEAGLLDPEVPGVYVAHNRSVGGRVVRIDEGGGWTLIAVWQFPAGRHSGLIPVSPEVL